MAATTANPASGTPAVLNELAKASRMPARRAEFISDALPPDDVFPDELVAQPAKVNVRAAANLAARVAERSCYFDADCGLYTLDPGSKTTLVGDNGVPHVIETPHIYVDFSKGPVALNPHIPGEATKIELLRKDIADAPQRAVVVGLMECGDGQIPRPMESWDNLRPDLKLEAVKNFGLDVEKTLKYELQNDGSQWLVTQLDALLAPETHEPALTVDEPTEIVPTGELLVDADATDDDWDEDTDPDQVDTEAEADGETDPALSERDQLKADAADLGLSFPGNIATTKLRELVEQGKAEADGE